MGQVFKKDIVYPDARAREIERWDTYMGIKYAVRKMKVQRVSPPQSGFTDGDQDRLGGLEEKIRELKAKPPAATPESQKRRDGIIHDFELELQELNVKRDGLTAWENLQIYRCIHGHRTMTGFHYFLYNFGFYEAIEKGQKKIIRPDYRAIDDWACRLFLKTRNERKGMIAAKRRRFGWSWLLVAWVIYHILFDDGNVFFVTKDDGDRDKFFARINFFYDRLPAFLKKPRGRDAHEYKSWMPSARIAAIRGIDIQDVPTAMLRTGSPKNKESVEGDTVSAFIIDEAGKIPNLLQVIMLGLPMLAGKDGITQEGMLILGGTAGEMTGSGRDLKRLFEKPEAFDLTPVALLAWMGAKMDEFGNDDKKATVEWAKKKRDFLEEAGQLRELTDFKQQYPFTIDEIFSIDDSSKNWPVKLIAEARDHYEAEGRKKVKYGRFIRELNGAIRFIPEKAAPSINSDFPEHIGYGQVMIIEEPDMALAEEKYAYVMGVDPVTQNKDKYKEIHGAVKAKYLNSDMAFVIHKRLGSTGKRGNHPVCMYAGREANLDLCYEQAVLAAQYYGCQMNIESNMGGRMHAYVLHRDPSLIAHGTSAVSNMSRSGSTVWGTNTTDAWWTRMMGIGENWWAQNYKLPNFLRLIDESMDIRERNTDVLVAWLLALQFAEEINARERLDERINERTRDKEELKFWEVRNGRWHAVKTGQASRPSSPSVGSRADQIYKTLMG